MFVFAVAYFHFHFSCLATAIAHVTAVFLFSFIELLVNCISISHGMCGEFIYNIYLYLFSLFSFAFPSFFAYLLCHRASERMHSFKNMLKLACLFLICSLFFFSSFLQSFRVLLFPFLSIRAGCMCVYLFLLVYLSACLLHAHFTSLFTASFFNFFSNWIHSLVPFFLLCLLE